MTSARYVTVEEAVALPGLRIAFTRGLPNPWSLAARAFFDMKGIPYTAVAQLPGEPNEALGAWTGQTSAPVAMLNDERPRSNWFEILLLAERLEPEPSLIPTDEYQRADMFGVSFEICAEDGLGWATRFLYWASKGASAAHSNLQAKYSSGETAEHARRRVNAVIELLSTRLESQAAKGREYLIGNQLSAADIYWTTFSNLFVPMANEECPMPDFYRTGAALALTHLDRPLPGILIQHRDLIVRRHFARPILC
jgi:glutathione S-transferase